MDGIESLMKCACYASFPPFVFRWRSFFFTFEVSGPIGDEYVKDGHADVVCRSNVQLNYMLWKINFCLWALYARDNFTAVYCMLLDCLWCWYSLWIKYDVCLWTPVNSISDIFTFFFSQKLFSTGKFHLFCIPTIEE